MPGGDAAPRSPCDVRGDDDVDDDGCVGGGEDEDEDTDVMELAKWLSSLARCSTSMPSTLPR